MQYRHAKQQAAQKKNRTNRTGSTSRQGVAAVYEFYLCYKRRPACPLPVRVLSADIC